MITFRINKPDEAIKPLLKDKIDNLTKPKGSLGTLECLALQIGYIQQTITPQLCNPHNILFAADHGIADEAVSVSPKEVTWQQVFHFLHGGAGINFLCHQHHFQLDVVDAGVDYEFPHNIGLIDKKVRRGTRNFLYEAAMSEEEFALSINRGADVVSEVYNKGCNIVSFGEMGIGNTSSSSLWMTYFTHIPLSECIGAGSGLDKKGIEHKYDVLKRSMQHYNGDASAIDIIRYFGGYEMVMAVGGMLRAAELGMIILIDGFIMTNCLLAASQLYPEVCYYAVYGHQGDEVGHKRVLDYMGAYPLLNLGLRLGEGSGAVCAYPIMQSAVCMINDMDSFKNASVTKYF